MKKKSLNHIICQMFSLELLLFGLGGLDSMEDQVHLYEIVSVMCLRIMKDNDNAFSPALVPNIQAVMACFVTNLAACVGGLTWVLLDYRHEHKYSTLGFCAGAVAGLVCITPGSGYVGPASR